MSSDKKTLLAEANASVKRNLISAGGCADTPVHVDAAGNADGVECWIETIIRNGLPPTLVDDPVLRKTLVTTTRMGQNFESRHTGLATRPCRSTLL
jgi:hypothetical protein